MWVTSEKRNEHWNENGKQIFISPSCLFSVVQITYICRRTEIRKISFMDFLFLRSLRDRANDMHINSWSEYSSEKTSETNLL